MLNHEGNTLAQHAGKHQQHHNQPAGVRNFPGGEGRAVRQQGICQPIPVQRGHGDEIEYGQTQIDRGEVRDDLKYKAADFTQIRNNQIFAHSVGIADEVGAGDVVGGRRPDSLQNEG